MIKKINIDKFRIFCAILIIAIHTYPFISINQNLEIIFTHIICRIGVPFFLMITGYFVLPKAINNKGKLIEYTKKILKIYIFCILLYLPINIYSGNLNNSIVDILKDIFINGTFYHLWYFPALILGIWIVFYLIKNLNTKKIIIILSILYLIGLFGDNYYKIGISNSIIKSFYNVVFSVFNYTRNGLFYTPMFLYLGYKFNDKKILNNSMILFIISLILMIIEGLIINYFNIAKHDSMYIILVPVMLFLFSLILNNSVSNNKKLRDMSTIIYIIHPLFIIIIRGIAKILNLENLMINNSLIHFLLVTILSILFSFVCERIKNKNT